MTLLKAVIVFAVLIQLSCGESIAEVAINTPDLSDLVGFVVQAGLVDFLNETSPLTVFAPPNSAFDALPDDVKQQLTNVTVLTSVLTYHVVQANVSSSQLSNDQLVETANGASVRTNVYTTPNGNVATINGARVVTPDIYASNGVVHLVEKVLLPPTTNISGALSNPAFSTLAAAVAGAGIGGVFDGSPFTVFAPTNDAFAELGEFVNLLLEPAGIDILTKILTYHVVPGTYFSAGIYDGLELATANNQRVTFSTTDGVKVNDASVVQADVLVTDGVIHVIDKVLLPEFNLYELNLISGLTTLNAAADAAGVNATLKNAEGPLTLFAPTNAAFSAIPADQLNDLLNNPTELTKILTYHVVPERVLAANLSNDRTFTTAFDDNFIRANIYGQTATINCARVVTANIGAGANSFVGSNGVIHTIDKVLMPVTQTLVEKVVSTDDLSILLTAVQAANLTSVLSGEGPFTVFAPTNASFTALGNTLNELLDKPDELSRVLLYHVVPGFTCSAGLSSGLVRTASGDNIEVSVSGSTVTINGNTNVIQADIVTKNAVIHIIDRVLLPPSPDTTTTTTGSGSLLAINVATLLAILLVSLLL